MCFLPTSFLLLLAVLTEQSRLHQQETGSSTLSSPVEEQQPGPDLTEVGTFLEEANSAKNAPPGVLGRGVTLCDDSCVLCQRISM